MSGDEGRSPAVGYRLQKRWRAAGKPTEGPSPSGRGDRRMTRESGDRLWTLSIETFEEVRAIGGVTRLRFPSRRVVSCPPRRSRAPSPPLLPSKTDPCVEREALAVSFYRLGAPVGSALTLALAGLIICSVGAGATELTSKPKFSLSPGERTTPSKTSTASVPAPTSSLSLLPRHPPPRTTARVPRCPPTPFPRSESPRPEFLPSPSGPAPEPSSTGRGSTGSTPPTWVARFSTWPVSGC